jgi:formyl-CoA transferase
MTIGDNPPLTGIRVLELGNFVAGPFATRLLADFGAEVIKVERPGAGDEIRRWRSDADESSMMFRTLARNKKSITVDLKSEEGRALVLSLVAHCDVVVENFRPGTLEKLGLGPERLVEAREDLVIVRISGYGQTGPYRDRAGFGGVAEAFAGLREVTGYPDRPPVRAAAPLGDTYAGLYGAVSALMLLLSRERGLAHDGPRVADVALYEAMFMAMDSLVPDMDAYGLVRERTAGNLPGVVPSGVFPTKDGQSVLVAGNSSGAFQRLMVAIGRRDLAEDPELADGRARYLREAELDEAIEAWTGKHDVDEVVRVLAEAGVPAGPVLNAHAIAENEHYRARQMVLERPVTVGGEQRPVRFPGIVPVIPGAPGSLRWIGPDLGEHTDAVLREVLGLDPDAVAALRRREVV